MLKSLGYRKNFSRRQFDSFFPEGSQEDNGNKQKNFGFQEAINYFLDVLPEVPCCCVV